MTERQIKALNNLYAATIEVMEAFSPETVRADQRREALSRMIENFLISASSPDNGIVMPQMPSYPSSNESEAEVRVKTGEQPHQPVQYQDDSSFEIMDEKYASKPIRDDDGILFKRPVSKEERLISEQPYTLKLGNEEGLFSLNFALEDYPSEKISNERFPDGVVIFQNEMTPPENASRLVTIENGKIIKQGKSWKIIKPVKVRYE